MLVIAIERGYDGEVVREPGAVHSNGQPVIFKMPDEAKGSWFVQCDETGKPLKPIPSKIKRGHEVPGAGPKPGSGATDINQVEGKSLSQIAAGPRRD